MNFQEFSNIVNPNTYHKVVADVLFPRRISPARFEAILKELSNGCDEYSGADRRVMLSRLATALGIE